MTTSVDVFLENAALAAVSTTTAPSGNMHSTIVLELNGGAFEPARSCSVSDSDDGVTSSSTSRARAMLACNANAGIATLTATVSSDTLTEYPHCVHGASACGRASATGSSVGGVTGGGMRDGAGGGVGTDVGGGDGGDDDEGAADEADGTRRTAAHSS